MNSTASLFALPPWKKFMKCEEDVCIRRQRKCYQGFYNEGLRNLYYLDLPCFCSRCPSALHFPVKISISVLPGMFAFWPILDIGKSISFSLPSLHTCAVGGSLVG